MTGLWLCGCPGFALTEGTGDILVVGLQDFYSKLSAFYNNRNMGAEHIYEAGLGKVQKFILRARANDLGSE